MADERIRKLAFRWGMVALLVEAYFAVRLASSACADLFRLVDKYGLNTLTDRMSQLKPAAFKFPWVGLYIALFAIVGLAVAGAMIYSGVQEAAEDGDDLDAADEGSSSTADH